MRPPEGDVMPICLHIHKLWGGSERVILWREGAFSLGILGMNLSHEKISLMKMRIKLGTQDTRSPGGIQSWGTRGLRLLTYSVWIWSPVWMSSVLDLWEYRIGRTPLCGDGD